MDTQTINAITDKMAQDYLLSPEALAVSFLNQIERLMGSFSEHNIDFYSFNETIMMFAIANKMAMDKANKMNPVSH